jgi:hypothetical protein
MDQILSIISVKVLLMLDLHPLKVLLILDADQYLLKVSLMMDVDRVSRQVDRSPLVALQPLHKNRGHLQMFELEPEGKPA